jgi:glutaminase
MSASATATPTTHLDSRQASRRDPSPMTAYLERLHTELADNLAGQFADYIPELAKADPRQLGIVVATVDGRVYQVGDSRETFTIQSISKAIAFGLALEDRGLDGVLDKVGVEPSGDAFNAISLDAASGRPRNPMINAGAIATAGLIEGADRDAAFARLQACFERFVGHALDVDEAVYRSESATGHRNRAIAHLLEGHGIIRDPADAVVEQYFRQCSLRISARDLAVMGAALANDGVNPVTGVRALSSRYVDKVLSVMGTCGMYDHSGNWMFRVGMPAKSGVGGGIMAVMPGQFGIGVFSPLLDDKGNSVRGVQACERIAAELGVHPYHVTRSTAATQVKQASERDCRDLGGNEAAGGRLAEFRLRGPLNLASILPVLECMSELFERADGMVLDLGDVTDIDLAATHMLAEMWRNARSRGKRIVMEGIADKYVFLRRLRRLLGDQPLAA